MKKNSLIIILTLIIIGLIGYIIFDKYQNDEDNIQEETITLVDNINLDYVDIYLTSDGIAYIKPINNEEINNLKVNNNLKDRLNTLYDRAFYFDIYIDNYKLKGFKIKLDSDIEKIRKVEIDNNYYVVFIKDNNTIGLFNYLEYYDLLYTKVEDNYNDLNNVLDIKNNKIIYLDGSRETFELKK
ncbi:MAG: hypothetical protein IJY87_05970 [Bacilli bacterium]|nr:hypothetical protein [Bacilli bacterium]